MERESARRSSLKGRERVIVNQMNIGTVWKATTWETSETGWSAYGLFRAHRYHLELKRTELLLLDKQQTRALHCRNTYKQGRRNLYITVWTDTLIKSIYPARVLYILFSTTRSQKNGAIHDIQLYTVASRRRKRKTRNVLSTSSRERMSSQRLRTGSLTALALITITLYNDHPVIYRTSLIRR